MPAWARRVEPLAAVLAAMALEALAVALAVVSAREGWLGRDLHGLSDALLYAGYAHAVELGRWPYLDFPFEYPPLALLLFAAPPAGGSLARYQFWFSLEMVVLLVAAAGFTAAAAWRLWRDAGRVLAAAAPGAAAPEAPGTRRLDRFDAAVALALAAALWAAAARRWTTGGAALGLGVALKLVPGALVPGLLWASGARWRRPLLALAAAALLPFLPFLALAPAGVVEVFRLHAGRPLQVESVPATALLVAGSAGWVHVDVVSGHGSQNLAGVWAGRLAAGSEAVLATVVAGSLWWLWRRRGALAARRAALPAFWLALVAMLLCASKVLSPQYVVWLFPLAALAVASRTRPGLAAGMLVVLAALLTGVEFPDMYWRLVALEPAPVAVVAARNAALLGAAVVAVAHLRLAWREGSAPGGEEHEAVVVGVGHRQAEHEGQQGEGDA